MKNLEEKEITKPKAPRTWAWWKALRYHFVPPSIFPATVGALVAWVVNHSFLPFYFLLVMIGVVVNHIALNMADDYFDYKHAVDKLKPEEKNPYSGGSGTLSSGLIKPPAMLKAFTIGFFITIATEPGADSPTAPRPQKAVDGPRARRDDPRLPGCPHG